MQRYRPDLLRAFDLNGHMLTISDGAFRFAITELSNFHIKLNPTATFTAENGTVDGEHASITLYAKYGAAGLYTDRARTTAAELVPQPETGYTLSAIKGNGSGALCPASPVLRGEAAQILMNRGA